MVRGNLPKPTKIPGSGPLTAGGVLLPDVIEGRIAPVDRPARNKRRASGSMPEALSAPLQLMPG